MMDDHRQLIFDLLAIIYEQSQAIALLLAQDGAPANPDTYRQMIEVHDRIVRRFWTVANRLGWTPSADDESSSGPPAGPG